MDSNTLIRISSSAGTAASMLEVIRVILKNSNDLESLSVQAAISLPISMNHHGRSLVLLSEMRSNMFQRNSNGYIMTRNCCSTSAFTASVLVSRKMLMNIAVQQGAKEGQKFIEYIDYLAASNFIPPNGKGWVDHIRRKGNEATHEIALMNQTDAEELIAFVEMLLKFIYEFPARVPKSP